MFVAAVIEFSLTGFFHSPSPWCCCHVDVPEQKLDDLRDRVAATRWPSKELVADRSQGVQLEALRALARYWLDEYDLGRISARLNALPQFVSEIDGVDVHFIRAAFRSLR